MFRTTKCRRLVLITVLMVLAVPLTTLLFHRSPEGGEEKLLLMKTSEMIERLNHAEMINRNRVEDILQLSGKFYEFIEKSNETSKSNLQPIKNSLSNLSSNQDVHLPTAYDSMPHLLKAFTSTKPLYKTSKGRTGVSVVLGIPTVKRNTQTYLLSTLHNLVNNMDASEKRQTLIVVCIAEPDLQYVAQTARQIEKQFEEDIESGLIDILAISPHFYPDLEHVKQSLGDTLERVKWRTKQNLDYSFLMMYAQTRGTYYVQLEDDILAKKGYITTMKKFALQKTAQKKDWFVLDFCELGFIGKMFKCADIPKFVQFIFMFYADKPVDWLLIHYVTTKVCSFDKDAKHCKEAKKKLWINYKPSLFQHIGTHSSLKGKVQKLKDKGYGKVQLFFPHSNPSAEVSCDIKHYKHYSLERAYNGQSYFWGLLPQKGDKLLFAFDPAVDMKKFFFRSGNAEHPSDKFFNTTVEILPDVVVKPKSTGEELEKNFISVGQFNDMGIAEGVINKDVGKVSVLRLTVRASSENWVILSEIMIESR